MLSLHAQWKITYYNSSIEEEILALPDTLLARYIRLTEVMQEHGPNIGMPHTKAVGEGLFELRLQGKEGIARVFFGVIYSNILMLYVIIKKTQKIPKHDLELVKKRLREVKYNAKKVT
jgi:phage-related protein